jgi:hypothetical protein
LAVLPAGLVAAGGGTVPDGIWDPMMKFSMDMMANMHDLYGLSKEQIEQMPKTSLTAMKHIRSMSMVLGVGPSGESLYGKFITVMQVDNTDAFMADYEKSLKEYGQFARNAHSPIPTHRDREEQITAPHCNSRPKPPTAGSPANTPILQDDGGTLRPRQEAHGWVVPVDEHAMVLGYEQGPIRSTTHQTGLAGRAMRTCRGPPPCCRRGIAPGSRGRSI